MTEEGLHRDVYRNGEKCRVEDVSPPIPASEASISEEDLRENVQRFIERSEERHGVTGGRNL